MAVVVGRLLWSMATYALACGRTDVIARLGSITATPSGGTRSVSVFAYRTFRYPDALGGSAAASFELYSSWLERLPFIQERNQLFVAECRDVFCETDLLLALRMIAEAKRKTYSEGAEADTVRRLASRFRDAAERPGLRTLFSVEEAELDQLVEACYQECLEYDREKAWEGLPECML